MMHNGVYQKPLYEAVFSTSCFWRIAKSVKKTRPEGFEPPTVRLEGGCSIQLSYGHM